MSKGFLTTECFSKDHGSQNTKTTKFTVIMRDKMIKNQKASTNN